MPDAHSRFPLTLAIAWTLLAIYGSLYPFAGWSDSGVPLGDFLVAGWPRYFTGFDLATNIAAYVPLGFLWVAALRSRLPAHLPIVATVLAATLIGTSLSLATETLQNFLPSRVPSNVDLACNALGSLLGALAGARWSQSLLDGGRLHALRTRLLLRGTPADAGLLLLLLWLLTQFNPETLLFGNGGLRGLLDLPTLMPYSAEGFARIEAAIVASHTLTIALVTTLLARCWRRTLVLAIIVVALMAKSFTFLLMMRGVAGLAWATPGSLAGLAAGLLLWLIASPLHARWRQALAASALLLATALVNLAPENPYLASTLQTWSSGQFLNFHGLTKLVSSLWPFLALPWLFLFRTESCPPSPHPPSR
ncbi:MAG: VanZ family protein [Rhodocyclaceae bacterium]|nr:VanZ family protein [Rhodocyclaceae bacterium]